MSKQKQHVAGVLMSSDSGNDPAYYFKKQQVEKRLGRVLTTDEFQRDYYEGPDTYQSGTSIFDPVLCELAYTWFTAPDAAILDPFAGGSVRGIVAAYLGRYYVGIDLRPEQIAANAEQGAAIVPDNMPHWIAGDSLEMDSLLPEGEAYDFIFSCPPYADLEVYSDDPRDISTMGYVDFLKLFQPLQDHGETSPVWGYYIFFSCPTFPTVWIIFRTCPVRISACSTVPFLSCFCRDRIFFEPFRYIVPRGTPLKIVKFKFPG